MKATKVKIHLFNVEQAFIDASVAYIISSASEAIKSKGFFHIVLSCGDTPIPIYEELAKHKINWSLWHFWFSDERCVKEDSNELNMNILQRALFDLIPISKNQIHLIPVSKGCEEAARIYAEDIDRIMELDLILLGIGEDGHTASLFPILYKQKINELSAIPVFNSPKLPTQRVSLSLQRINRCSKILFLVSGKNKLSIINRFINFENIPATKVCGKTSTDLFYFIPS